MSTIPQCFLKSKITKKKKEKKIFFLTWGDHWPLNSQTLKPISYNIGHNEIPITIQPPVLKALSCCFGHLRKIENQGKRFGVDKS